MRRDRRVGGSTAAAADRALGALYGLAIGDALGMPTQELSRANALAVLGPEPDFRAGPEENPISRGLPAGSVTDDTLQSLLVARLLVEGGGRIEPRSLADNLLAWEREMAERGMTGLLGPSTRSALDAVAGGADPAATGGGGITNGAAMRIAPVGIVMPPEPIEGLVEAVAAAGKVTHDTGVANAGAAAVAMVVSCGVAGMGFEEALGPAAEAAARAARFGLGHHDNRVAAGLHRAVSLVRAHLGDERAAVAALLDGIGTGVATEESVPAAFGVAALAPTDAWRACGIAAGLGGDTDTIAALAGAMVGACTGLVALPAQAVATVRRVNQLDLEPVVADLLALRRSAR